MSILAIQNGNTAIAVEFHTVGLPSSSYGFIVGVYDRTKTLVIDPIILNWSTYLGGSNSEKGFGLAVDTAGCVYVTGQTLSTDFPTVNAYSSTINMFTDVFVTKFAADGQSLIYSTYLGGSAWDERGGIVVDVSGCAYITGITSSTDFPTSANAYNTTYSGGTDAFIINLTLDGQSMLYSTYLGGSEWDGGRGIVVDASGCAYIIGWTGSDNFPIVNAYDATQNEGWDVFVIRFDFDSQTPTTTKMSGHSLLISPCLN